MKLEKLLGLVGIALRNTDLEGEEEYLLAGKTSRNMVVHKGFTFVGNPKNNGLDKRFISQQNQRRLMVDDQGQIRLFQPFQEGIVYKGSMVIYMEPTTEEFEFAKSQNKSPKAEFWILANDLESFMAAISSGEVLQVKKLTRDKDGKNPTTPESVWVGKIDRFLREYSETDEFKSLKPEESGGQFVDYHFFVSKCLFEGSIQWRTIKDPRKILDKIPAGRGRSMSSNTTLPVGDSWSPSDDVNIENPVIPEDLKVPTKETASKAVLQSDSESNKEEPEVTSETEKLKKVTKRVTPKAPRPKKAKKAAKKTASAEKK